MLPELKLRSMDAEDADDGPSEEKPGPPLKSHSLCNLLRGWPASAVAAVLK